MIISVAHERRDVFHIQGQTRRLYNANKGRNFKNLIVRNNKGSYELMHSKIFIEGNLKKCDVVQGLFCVCHISVQG